MHEADDAYSIRSTWSCYWLDQFLTLALNILILSIFYISMDLSTNYFALLVGVELPLRVVVTILECCVTFSGVKLSIRSFVYLLLYTSCTLRNEVQSCAHLVLPSSDRSTVEPRYLLYSLIQIPRQLEHFAASLQLDLNSYYPR